MVTVDAVHERTSIMKYAITLSLLLAAGCAKSYGARESAPGSDLAGARSASSAAVETTQVDRNPAAGSNAGSRSGTNPRQGVPLPTPFTPVDSTISDNVRQAILAERSLQMDAGNVHVATQDGVVTLTGVVRSQASKERFGVVVNAVGSVVRVDNQLVVDVNAAPSQGPMETTVDRAISERVRQAIRDDKTVAAEAGNIGVTTKDGVVTLTGTVRSSAIKQHIAVVASAAGSVVRVDDQLMVKSDR